jgi:hypothetical protein
VVVQALKPVAEQADHPDLTTPAALAAPHDYCAAPAVKIALSQHEGCDDPQRSRATAPRSRRQPQSVRTSAGNARDRGELLNRWRVRLLTG